MGAVGKAMGITISPPIKQQESKSESIEAIAQASGIRIRLITLEEDWWKSDRGPLLGMTQDNQPIALLPNKKKQYELFDPIICQRIRVNQTIAQQIAPIAYVLYRPFPDKKLTTLEIFKFAFTKQIREVLIIAFLGILTALFAMLTPQATALLVDYILPDANRQLLIQMGLGLVFASFAMTILEIIQSFFILRLQTQVSSETQAAIWDRLLKLKVSFFPNYSTGDLQERVSAVSDISSLLGGNILKTLLRSFFALLNLGLLFYYNWQLALIALILATITSITTIISGLITTEQIRFLQEVNGEIFGFTVQLIEGISKLRVAGAENRAFNHWVQKYRQQVKLMLSTQIMEDFLTLFNTIIPTISLIFLFWWVVRLMENPLPSSDLSLSTGQFMAFYVAFTAFIDGVTGLSNKIIDLLEIGILWERTKPILHAEVEKTNLGVEPGELSGQLKLEQVSFRYGIDTPLILDKITLEAEPGEFIAITGPSGSGKSTIVRLLLGFEQPTSGRVTYDGRDLAILNIAAVRQQLGVVLQNSRVLSGSIWEVLAGGTVISLEQAMEAIQLAGLAEDIEAMPMGIHTIISDGGGNLSGGQKQRLLIARALVHKPKILIFDEATSALDNRTQAIVTKSLEQLGVTRVVIAHRLSTIKSANRIYELKVASRSQ
ncbi:MAG TPA: NHLP bacteriocin export ABC transporter permease/ATPase subunit [Cyanothece sp. UBA12306]|nr:NHLP bacteriocin export ABC transporter permease/ATPase subunit [Cyanothece sp. UBA12306]